MALNDTQTKVHLDAATDDPKQARGELATNVDTYNLMVALLKTIATLNIGDGVKDDGSGNLDIDLGTNPGLQVIAAQLLAKVGQGNKLTASGIETDINGLTADGAPDIAADFVVTYDGSAAVLKKVLLNKLGTVPGADSITQTEIANAAVGQGELKTTTGDISDSSNGTLQVKTGPGGEYGFWPTIKHNTIFSSRFVVAPAQHRDADATPQDQVTTIGDAFLQRFTMGVDTGTLTVRQRYVQASPPYFLGAIQIPTFIFALIEDGTGKILSMYQAADPPWANNGPTNIRPQRVDKNGKAFKTIRTRKPLANADDLDIWTDTEIEITPDYKNSDMGLIPHPFIGNDLTGKTVVMVDPRMKLVERLDEMIEAGESPLELFHNEDVRVGNTDILAVTRPSGVMVVNATLK